MGPPPPDPRPIPSPWPQNRSSAAKVVDSSATSRCHPSVARRVAASHPDPTPPAAAEWWSWAGHGSYPTVRRTEWAPQSAGWNGSTWQTCDRLLATCEMLTTLSGISGKFLKLIPTSKSMWPYSIKFMMIHWKNTVIIWRTHIIFLGTMSFTSLTGIHATYSLKQYQPSSKARNIFAWLWHLDMIFIFSQIPIKNHRHSLGSSVWMQWVVSFLWLVQLMNPISCGWCHRKLLTKCWLDLEANNEFRVFQSKSVDCTRWLHPDLYHISQIS